ncbi:hypothetical protein FRB99_003711 [Tulasnella sp. 403]|nr:hypothetical protein FRB99_003711 [Tulasnella sp. 403]
MPPSRPYRIVIILCAATLFYIFSPVDLQLDFDSWHRPSNPLQRLSTSSPVVMDNRVKWENSRGIPQTQLLRHVTGWSVFKNLYAANGTFFIISDRPESFPPIREMIGTGHPPTTAKEDEVKHEPTDRDMQIISTQKAIQLFGNGALHISGTSVNLQHYYHLIGEMIMGLWRIYSTLDPDITPGGKTTLAPPSRIIFPHIDFDEWQDGPRVNQVILHAAFPSASIEVRPDWRDRASNHQLHILDTVALTERYAAKRAKNIPYQNKVSYLPHRVPGSRHWWEPVRYSILEFAGMHRRPDGTIEKPKKPVITYVSRQGGPRRALTQESDEQLVKALKELETKHGWEVNVLFMQHMSKADQIKAAGRSTILIGVHGNGLTALLWMLPSPSATVMEIFVPGAYAPDYSVPADMVGIEHYGIWHDQWFRTHGNEKLKVRFPYGFHGTNITVDGPTVARLCEERILRPTELSENVDLSLQKLVKAP